MEKNDMLDLLRTRRSIRKFTDQPIEKEKVDSLVKSALLAPTSKGLRSWEFVVVQDKETLEKLSKSRSKANMIHVKDAALAIVVLGDTTKTDVWVEDTSIAAILIQLEAHSLGLGSCWIQIRNRMCDENTTSDEYVREVLGIPEKYSVDNIIVIGYPNQERRPYRDEDLPYEKVHWEKF